METEKENLINIILNITIFSLLVNLASLVYLFLVIIKEKIITLDYTNGFILESVWRLKNGLGLYNDFSNNFNSLVALYPPVTYYYFLIINKLSGLTLNLNFLLFSNFIILIFLIILIYKISFLETKNKKISMIVVLVFFLFIHNFLLSILGKIDLLAIFLNFLGIYIYIKFRYNKLIYLSLIPFIIALFAKQTAIIIFIAVLVDLLFSDIKKFSRFLIIFSFSSLLIFLVINHETGGAFYHSAVEPHLLTEISFSRILLFLLFIEIPNILLIIISLLSLTGISNEQIRKNLWLSMLSVSILFNFYLLGKTGSNSNYLTELFIIISILIGIFLTNFINTPDKNTDKIISLPLLGKKMVSCFLLFLIVSFFMVFRGLNNANDNLLTQFVIKEEAISQKKLNQFFIKNKDKNILSEENTFNLINNKHSTFYEFAIFNLLIKNNKWDQEILFNALKNNYSYIVLTTNINREPSKLDFYLNQYYLNRFDEDFIFFIKNNFELNQEIKKEDNSTRYYILKNNSIK